MYSHRIFICCIYPSHFIRYLFQSHFHPLYLPVKFLSVIFIHHIFIHYISPSHFHPLYLPITFSSVISPHHIFIRYISPSYFYPLYLSTHHILSVISSHHIFIRYISPSNFYPLYSTHHTFIRCIYPSHFHPLYFPIIFSSVISLHRIFIAPASQSAFSASQGGCSRGRRPPSF